MHGRVKVRSSEEQKLEKHKKQQKKLETYRLGLKQILFTRSKNNESCDPESVVLSAQLLVLNPDIYTLWNYRKEIVLMEIARNEKELIDEETFEKFLENELSLTELCLLENPKSYCSWYHRYWVLERHPKPNWQKEFDHCIKYITKDERNLHCWNYRRLIVNKMGLSMVDELKFTTDRINENFSNYSSWHYRSTLRNLDENSVESEIMLVQSAIFTDPADSSAWFYLKWVLSNPGVTSDRKKELMKALGELLTLDPDCKWILLAKCWLTEYLIKEDKSCEDNRAEFYKELIKLDPMRKGHYEERLNAIIK